jgi:zinc D-Ala-D-Ala carboxypeptidase
MIRQGARPASAECPRQVFVLSQRGQYETVTFPSASAHMTETVAALAPPTVDSMNALRDRVFAVLTHVIAVVLLIPAWLRSPRRARRLACRWALALRFPAEDLDGLTPATLAAFTAARTEAFWRHGRLIGLTSGHRDAAEQQRLFLAEVARTGSVEAARTRVLPAKDSVHVRGTALDIRPREGAQWLEEHGARYDLYRTYDNEWWHFEHRPGEAPPARLPHPGRPAGTEATHH